MPPDTREARILALAEGKLKADSVYSRMECDPQTIASAMKVIAASRELEVLSARSTIGAAVVDLESLDKLKQSIRAWDGDNG